MERPDGGSDFGERGYFPKGILQPFLKGYFHYAPSSHLWNRECMKVINGGSFPFFPVLGKI